jgi:hypothetical protein
MRRHQGRAVLPTATGWLVRLWQRCRQIRKRRRRQLLPTTTPKYLSRIPFAPAGSGSGDGRHAPAREERLARRLLAAGNGHPSTGEGDHPAFGKGSQCFGGARTAGSDRDLRPLPDGEKPKHDAFISNGVELVELRRDVRAGRIQVVTGAARNDAFRSSDGSLVGCGCSVAGPRPADSPHVYPSRHRRPGLDPFTATESLLQFIWPC